MRGIADVSETLLDAAVMWRGCWGVWVRGNVVGRNERRPRLGELWARSGRCGRTIARVVGGKGQDRGALRVWWQNDFPSEVRIVENWEFLMRWVDGCFIVPCRAVPCRAAPCVMAGCCFDYARDVAEASAEEMFLSRLVVD